jgi:hypothetical protein
MVVANIKPWVEVAALHKDPNVTLLIEQEADSVARDETLVRERIKKMLETPLAGHREAILWPEKPVDISDRDPSFLVAYLPLEFRGKFETAQEAGAKELREKYGDKPRQYRNGLGLLREVLERRVCEDTRRGQQGKRSRERDIHVTP